MDNGAFGQFHTAEELQEFLPSIIRSLQEESNCPPKVMASFKELEGRTDITIEDLPTELKFVAQLILDRDDALVQNNKLVESEQDLQEKLMKTQQEKEQAEASLKESVEMGTIMSDLCDNYCENCKSLSTTVFTSGSEKIANLSEALDEETDLSEDGKSGKTKDETREKIGNYFRSKSAEMEATENAKNKKGGRKSNKNQGTTAEASGSDVVEHIGEEDLGDFTYDEYGNLTNLTGTIGANTQKASDGKNITWARLESGHFENVVSNIDKKEVFHNIRGKLLSGECPPKKLEIGGVIFELIGYDAFTEIKMNPATAILEKHLYPKYKTDLKQLGEADRNVAILMLQKLVGPDIYIDGSKKASAIVSALEKQESILEEGIEETAATGDDNIPADYIEDNTDVNSEEEQEIADDKDNNAPEPMEDTGVNSEEELENSEENEEGMTSSVSPEEESENNIDKSAQTARGKRNQKISRREANKERDRQQQVNPDENAEERKREDAQRKEEMAQKKRENAKARHEQKKQEKLEKKKAENPDFKPTEKRSTQRTQTFGSTARNGRLAHLFSGKSYWSPSLVAYILFLSVVMMLPIYRIQCASSVMLGGLNIPLSTIEALSILVFNRKLKHLLPYFYKALKAENYIQADETVLEVFRENMRKNATKSYIWIYSTIATSPMQVRIYDYKPGRKGEFCKAVLASFAGVLITDAYQGYNLVDGVQHAFCFIHARRKIYDAAKNGANRYTRQLAKKILILIDELFRIEQNLQAAGLDPEALAKERQQQMSGILSTLKDCLTRIQKDRRISANGKLAKAANYMLNHYEELTYFLKDGNVPMHNQVSEHAARRVALYRNNSMFCGSPEGAKALAGILTIAETARANNLDVYKYFLFILENMRGDNFWKDEELMKSLLPWSERAQAECASNRPLKVQKIRLIGGNIAI